MSQEALAQAIKRTPESVSNIERGVQLPALDTLLDLAASLKITAGELLGPVSEPRKITRQRAEAEAKLAAIAADLPDNVLVVAVAQIESLAGLKRGG
jgi:transcriptional regulator with XRE-family HTH domain